MPEDKLKIIHCQCHKIALCQTKHLHLYWLTKCRQNSYKKTAPEKNGKECDGSDKSVDWLETCCHRTMPLMGEIKARRQPKNNEGFLWQHCAVFICRIPPNSSGITCTFSQTTLLILQYTVLVPSTMHGCSTVFCCQPSTDDSSNELLLLSFGLHLCAQNLKIEEVNGTERRSVSSRKPCIVEYAGTGIQIVLSGTEIGPMVVEETAERWGK
ncbi:hypothetical protein T4A_10474 [Trichinella pseudospiralis]|uniref:Uncharacterized protein n=1 Tax=Trichinella pseudospiralis TaxID=6337 RepID=A0A0V1DTJ6_TRIPS|nr:hypothetical protein T4A_10474 [Trichinella pseudospiralis]